MDLPKPRTMVILLAIGVLAVLFVRAEPPTYPDDWPPLDEAVVEIAGEDCPDLSGSYVLPPTVPMRVRLDERPDFERPHRFLGVDPFFVPGTKQARSIRPPTRMALQGPTTDGLRVLFFAADGSVLVDQTLRPGTDFTCADEWIADPREEVTRAKPRRWYGRDVDGRLIGHQGYADFGIFLLFGFAPTPVYVNDQAWWRLERAWASEAGVAKDPSEG